MSGWIAEGVEWARRAKVIAVCVTCGKQRVYGQRWKQYCSDKCSPSRKEYWRQRHQHRYPEYQVVARIRAVAYKRRKAPGVRPEVRCLVCQRLRGDDERWRAYCTKCVSEHLRQYNAEWRRQQRAAMPPKPKVPRRGRQPKFTPEELRERKRLRCQAYRERIKAENGPIYQHRLATSRRNNAKRLSTAEGRKKAVERATAWRLANPERARAHGRAYEARRKAKQRQQEAA